MTVRNWLTDPIYFDIDPTPVNQWMNANELIETNRREEIFLADSQMLNLFSILVRRVDFVRESPSDRILARFPFVCVTDAEKEIICSQELLIAEKLRDYFYQSDNRKILKWREILRKYLERGAVPLPFLRCFPDNIIINIHERVLESARGERFAMPVCLTPELAYLCGMVNGDGNLTRYVLNIVDYSMENIRQLKEQFERLFHQTGRIQLQTENSPTLIITNLWVVRLFSFLTDQPIGGKKYNALREPLLFREELLRSHYWSGVMDADGSYANGSITFTSTSRNFVMDFINFLKNQNVKTAINEREDGTFQVYLSREYNEIYKEFMICFHPEKKLLFQNLKKGKKRKSKYAEYFHGFNPNIIRNGFFDFSKLNGLQVIGLGEYIREARDEKTQFEFAQELKISLTHVHLLEKEKSAISVPLLQKLLILKNNDLMLLLVRYGKKLQFRRLSALPVFLDLKPNNTLIHFAKKMLFYNNFIRIDSKSEEFIFQIENHFGVPIENNIITNGTIRYFFKIISLLKPHEKL